MCFLVLARIVRKHHTCLTGCIDPSARNQLFEHALFSSSVELLYMEDANLHGVARIDLKIPIPKFRGETRHSFDFWIIRLPSFPVPSEWQQLNEASLSTVTMVLIGVPLIMRHSGGLLVVKVSCVLFIFYLL